jgi:hypothetical protein
MRSSPAIQSKAVVASGTIFVFQEDVPDHFRKLAHVVVETKVHSLAVDVRTHRVYAPEDQEHGRPVAKVVVFDAMVELSATYDAIGPGSL